MPHLGPHWHSPDMNSIWEADRHYRNEARREIAALQNQLNSLPQDPPVHRRPDTLAIGFLVIVIAISITMWALVNYHPWCSDNQGFNILALILCIIVGVIGSIYFMRLAYTQWYDRWFFVISLLQFVWACFTAIHIGVRYGKKWP